MATADSLHAFLEREADALCPIDPSRPDRRSYAEHTQPEAHPARGIAWLEAGVSSVWRVGVLAQWDARRCDHARLLIGHERSPGRFEFIGLLFWRHGENDDIGRVLPRYVECWRDLGHSVFHPADLQSERERRPT